MQNPMRGTGAPGAQAPVSAFCWWEIRDKGLSVHLHLSTVEWLENEMADALRSPERKEIGGLLLGRTEFDRRRRIVIEGFAPVSCEHQFGPAYQLSSHDKQVLVEEMARWEPRPRKNLYVVGFYRCHNREGFGLDDQDVALAREFFSDAPSIFLLIKPFPDQVSMAGLFFSEEGEIQCDSKLLFPFSRTSLAAGDTSFLSPREHEQKPESVWEEDPVELQLESSDPIAILRGFFSRLRTAAEQLRSRWPWVLAVGILSVVLVVAAYRVWHRPGVPEVQAVVEKTDGLALKVDIEKTQLRVSWDKNSPLIKGAKAGGLSIMDGVASKDLNLDSYLLRTGSIVYSHATDDVTVRLHVLSGGTKASESVRVIGGDRSGSQWAPAAIVERSARPSTPRSTELKLKPVTQATTDRGIGDRTRGPAAGRSASRSEQRPQQTAADVRPRPTAPAEQAKADPLVPARRSTTGPKTPAEPATKSSNVSSEGAGLAPPRNQGTSVVEQTGAQSPVQSDAAVRDPGSETATEYIGPLPLRRVDPNPYFKLPPFIVDSVQINVRVYVDSTGKVVRTESLSKGNTLMEHLSKIASEAARQWTFAPARLGTQSVSSHTVLQFQFVNRLK